MTCRVPECERSVWVKELCSPHYQRHRRSGDPLGKQVMRDSVPRICTAEGCEKPHAARGYCGTHYERLRRNGTIEIAPYRPQGKGTVHNGYVVFSRQIDGQRVHLRRCRLVMEEMIGRKLLPEETVHHRNGLKHDDRPENLELWASRHPKGQRVSDLIDFAHEILDLYDTTSPDPAGQENLLAAAT